MFVLLVQGNVVEGQVNLYTAYEHGDAKSTYEKF